MSRQVAITDFLTQAEIDAVIHLWRTDRPNFHKRVIVEVIEPNQPEIDRKLGQKNSPSFIAYALEFVIGEASQ